MIYIGIDPGINGGIAVIRDSDAVAYSYTSSKLINILRDVKETNESLKVFVEEVHSMPAQGVASTFTFGKGFGIILGILEAYEVPYDLVKPQTWKKFMGVTHDKQTSIRKAQKLFPDVSLLATPRCRVLHDGMAEALLIAYYGKNVNKYF